LLGPWAPLISTRLQPGETSCHEENPFQRVSLHTEAVKTAFGRFSTIITGLKPGANENFPPLLKIEMRSPCLLRRAASGSMLTVIQA